MPRSASSCLTCHYYSLACCLPSSGTQKCLKILPNAFWETTGKVLSSLKIRSTLIGYIHFSGFPRPFPRVPMTKSSVRREEKEMLFKRDLFTPVSFLDSPRACRKKNLSASPPKEARERNKPLLTHATSPGHCAHWMSGCLQGR